MHDPALPAAPRTRRAAAQMSRNKQTKYCLLAQIATLGPKTGKDECLGRDSEAGVSLSRLFNSDFQQVGEGQSHQRGKSPLEVHWFKY